MVSLLPITRGFTAFFPTAGCLLCIGTALFCLSRLIQVGIGMSFLSPLSSAMVPLAAIIISALVYGERASIPKLTLLFGACGLIGVASAVS